MIRVTANPNIGCKYPGTINDRLVRSMATIIRIAAGRYPNPTNRPRNPDPNEGSARPWPTA